MRDLLIRRDEAADAADTWRVFQAAVHGTASRDYTPEQILAWAPPSVNEARWQARRSAAHTYVACLGEAVVGFSDFTDDGLLDMLFVHPDAGGRGVARALVTRIIHEASAAGHRRLRVHASLTARPAFERFGFTVDAHRWFLVPMFWLIRWTLRVLWWLCLAYYYVLIRPLAIVWRHTAAPVRTFLRRF